MVYRAAGKILCMHCPAHALNEISVFQICVKFYIDHFVHNDMYLVK
jgi:hypothetical protein